MEQLNWAVTDEMRDNRREVMMMVVVVVVESITGALMVRSGCTRCPRVTEVSA